MPRNACWCRSIRPCAAICGWGCRSTCSATSWTASKCRSGGASIPATLTSPRSATNGAKARDRCSGNCPSSSGEGRRRSALFLRRAMMRIRVGFEIVYDCPQPTPMILNLNVHFTRASDLVGRDDLVVDPPVPMTAYRDSFGNWCTRIVASKGRTRVSADAIVNDTGLPDPIVPEAQQHPVPDLPEETLLFLLGSRYCETDRLSDTAWNLFGHGPTGWGRVLAICDWVNRHIA